MNILIISPFFKPNMGGVETHLSDLCEYLSKQNHNVYVITYQPLTTKARGLSKEIDGNLRIRRLKWFGFNLFHKLEKYPVLQFLYLTPWLFIYSFCYMVVNSKKIDIIHAHGFTGSLIAKVLKIVFKKRIVASTHAIYNLKEDSSLSKRIHWILKSFDSILTLSKQSKQELMNIGISENKIKVYTYWIDLGKFSPVSIESLRQKLNWDDKFAVLFVGRFIPIKGMGLLIECAKKFSNNVIFAFIGDGPMAESLKNECSKNKNTVFIGKIPNDMLPEYYSAADVFAVPSLYEEGFGRVIIESIACGTPVIASNKGGIPEAVDSSVGILIEPNADNFARSIQKLIDNPEMLEKMKKNCRKYALEKFSILNAKLIEDSYSGQ